MWRALTAKGVTGVERWRLYQRLCGGTKTASIWFHVVVEKEVRQVELRPVTEGASEMESQVVPGRNFITPVSASTEAVLNSAETA